MTKKETNKEQSLEQESGKGTLSPPWPPRRRHLPAADTLQHPHHSACRRKWDSEEITRKEKGERVKSGRIQTNLNAMENARISTSFLECTYLKFCVHKQVRIYDKGRSPSCLDKKRYEPTNRPTNRRTLIQSCGSRLKSTIGKKKV